MSEVLDEIFKKTAHLSDKEQLKFIRETRAKLIQQLQELNQLLQEQDNQDQIKSGKGFVHPNTIWVKKHRAEYPGKYVALEDGKLVGIGKNYPEALAQAKQNGSEKPMITYIFPLDSEPFGGW